MVQHVCKKNISLKDNFASIYWQDMEILRKESHMYLLDIESSPTLTGQKTTERSLALELNVFWRKEKKLEAQNMGRNICIISVITGMNDPFIWCTVSSYNIPSRMQYIFDWLFEFIEDWCQTAEPSPRPHGGGGRGGDTARQLSVDGALGKYSLQHGHTPSGLVGSTWQYLVGWEESPCSQEGVQGDWSGSKVLFGPPQVSGGGGTPWIFSGPCCGRHHLLPGRWEHWLAERTRKRGKRSHSLLYYHLEGPQSAS